MKQITLINKIILCAILLMTISCSQDKDSALYTAEKLLEKEAQMHPVNDFPGKIPMNIGGLGDIVLNPDQHTWQDLDRYYREELPKYEGEHFYENLKSKLFFHLIEQFRIDEEADIESVSYYTREQFASDFLVAPHLFVRCLERMRSEGAYPPHIMRRHVFHKYHDLMNKIAQRDDPEGFLERFGYRYEALRKFKVEVMSN